MFKVYDLDLNFKGFLPEAEGFTLMKENGKVGSMSFTCSLDYKDLIKNNYLVYYDQHIAGIIETFQIDFDKKTISVKGVSCNALLDRMGPYTCDSTTNGVYNCKKWGSYKPKFAEMLGKGQYVAAVMQSLQTADTETYDSKIVHHNRDVYQEDFVEYFTYACADSYLKMLDDLNKVRVYYEVVHGGFDVNPLLFVDIRPDPDNQQWHFYYFEKGDQYDMEVTEESAYNRKYTETIQDCTDALYGFYTSSYLVAREGHEDPNTPRDGTEYQTPLYVNMSTHGDPQASAPQRLRDTHWWSKRKCFPVSTVSRHNNPETTGIRGTNRASIPSISLWEAECQNLIPMKKNYSCVVKEYLTHLGDYVHFIDQELGIDKYISISKVTYVVLGNEDAGIVVQCVTDISIEEDVYHE